MNHTLEQMHAEWTERKRPPLPTGGHEGARPQRRDLPAGVPRHVVEWAAKVKATRLRWKWTQKQLGEKIGLDTARLSKLERGKWLPPDDIIAHLCEVLDLDAPESARG